MIVVGDMMLPRPHYPDWDAYRADLSPEAWESDGNNAGDSSVTADNRDGNRPGHERTSTVAQTEFDDFTITVETKPESGVTVGEIPAKLAEYLKANFKAALEDPDHKELKLTAKDEKQAKILAAYARAWGARQEPKLRITKLPNGNRFKENVARLQVVLESSVTTKPGRKPGSAK